MKRCWKRVLSAALALAMVCSMLPAAAWATGEEGSGSGNAYDGVGGVGYVEASPAAPLGSGGVFVIYGSHGTDGKNMHHSVNGTASSVNQCTDPRPSYHTIGEGCANSAHLWEIVPSGDGFTIASKLQNNGKTMYLHGEGSTLSMSETGTVFTIAPRASSDYYDISYVSSGTTYYLTWNSHWLLSTSDADHIRLFKQTPAPAIKEIPGYTRVSTMPVDGLADGAYLIIAPTAVGYYVLYPALHSGTDDARMLTLDENNVATGLCHVDGTEAEPLSTSHAHFIKTTTESATAYSITSGEFVFGAASGHPLYHRGCSIEGGDQLTVTYQNAYGGFEIKEGDYYLGLTSAHGWNTTSNPDGLAVRGVLLFKYNNVDLTDLNAAIARAEALTGSLYTDDTWAELTTALNTAKAVAAKASPTEAEATEALTGLNHALDALALKPPAVPGYTQVGSTALLQTGGVYMLLAQDSAGNVYALYPHTSGTSLSAGNAIADGDGTITAQLTVSGETVTATHLSDSQTVELDSLHCAIVKNGEDYNIQFTNNLYLSIDGYMLSEQAKALDMSVSGGTFTITGHGTDIRVLDFNKAGDPHQFVNGSRTFHTNFWGPGERRFPIFVYAKNGTVQSAEELLRAEIDACNALTGDDYALSTWTALQAALTTANTAIEAADRTEETMLAALDALQSAHGGLILKSLVKEVADLIPEESDTVGQPFADGTGGSNSFRIPAIDTIPGTSTHHAGRIVAAADARWNHHGDGCALDTIFSYSDDNGEHWHYSFPNYFGDSVNAKEFNAVSIIDPVILAGRDGTIYLMADLFPGGVALNTAPMKPAAASGYVEIDNVRRLVIYTSGVTGQQTDSNYIAYVGDFAEGYAPILDKTTNESTGYYVDTHYYLYKQSGDAKAPEADKIYCRQLGSEFYVQQNVFFYNAELHVRNACYLYLVTSTDGGATWSDPTLLNPQIRKTSGNDQFYGVGPGAGLSFVDGNDHEIILLPAYTYSNERSSFIYSADGGATWKRSGEATSSYWSSESCLVQLNATTVRHFYRDSSGTLDYTDHTWDGTTFTAGTPVQQNLAGFTRTKRNQVSAIKYSQLIDGKEAIIYSTAALAGTTRNNGKLYVLLLDDQYNMTLGYTYEVTDANTLYGYSSITELSDGSIGLLHEPEDTGLCRIAYYNIPIGEIANGAVIGTEQTLTVPLYGTLEISAPDATAAGAIKTALEAADAEHIASAAVNGNTITYTGLKEGTVTFTANNINITLTVAVVGLEERDVAIRVGEEQKFLVGAGTTVTHTGDTAVASAAMEQVDLDRAYGAAGTDNTFTGTPVDLAEALYTFTGNADSGFTVRSVAHENVYLNINGTSAGMPGANTAGTIRFSTGSAENSFYVDEVTGSDHHYLYFWRDGKCRFDRNSTADAAACSMLLYRPAGENDTSSTELPGYVRVLTVGEITDGGQYLIAANYNGNYFVLKPVISSNHFDHVLKAVTSGRCLCITGAGQGTTNVVAGDTLYRVTVSPALYTITFMNESTQVEQKTVEGGAVIGLPSPEPTRAGYTFGGWYTDVSDGSTKLTDNTTATGDATYLAKWTEIAVTGVTISPSEAQTLKVGGSVTLTAAVAPEDALDKTVIWTSSDENVATVNNGVVTAVAAGTADITAAAGEQTATVAVTVERGDQAAPTGISGQQTTGEGTNDGKITGLDDTKTYEYRAKTTAEGGWTTVTGRTEITGLAPGTYEVRFPETNALNASPAVEVVVGEHHETMYAVTVDAGITNGRVTASPSGSVTVGTEVTVTATPNAGYQLTADSLKAYKTGDTSTEVTITDGKFTMPEHAVTVTAAFEQITYTITFKTSTEDTGTTKTVAHGAVIGLPEEPTKEGYTFGGWYTDVSDEATKLTENTTAAGDVTYFAKWTENEGPVPAAYTITFMNEGTQAEQKTVAHGAVIGLPEEPTKAGYTFGGWYTDLNDETTKLTDNTAAAGDATYLAKWTENEKPGPGPVIPTPVPTPAPKPEVKENEDGSTTTTVTDPETGVTTETTVYPNGREIEKSVNPGEGVTITVTDENGKTAAKIEVPAELPEPPSKFVDVPEAHWAEKAIHAMAGLGVVKGVGEHRYDMASSMTRGSVATVLYRLSNGDGAGAISHFADVNTGAEYADAVNWAAEYGVVKGYTGETFAPGDMVTREQLGVMLYRYAQMIGLDSATDGSGLDGFRDGDTAAGWAAKGMAWCVENGILKGKGDKTLDPKAEVSRAEAAVMLSRFLELLKDL